MTDTLARPWGNIPHETIADFSRRNRIRRLALFGSALRDDFRPDSDLDILVEFEPDTRIGLRFFALQRELSEILGRPAISIHPAFSALTSARQ